MIYDEYATILETHRGKYGEATVLFMQIGDFFELYQTDVAEPHLYRVCDICNIQVTRKNKSVPDVSRQNPLMAGFPLYALPKYIQTLVAHGYTIVVVRQVTPPPNPRRAVTEVVGPSTFMAPQQRDGHYLMVQAWEKIGKIWIAAFALVDVTTGQTVLYEAASSDADPHYAEDEAQRMVQTYAPKEVVVLGRGADAASFCGGVGASVGRIHNKGEDYGAAFRSPAYRDAIFCKAYPGTGLCTPSEVLELECRPLLSLAFAYLLQFTFEHNETLIQKLQRPHRLLNDTCLHVHSTAALQLNILSNVPGETPLLDILNRCATAMGTRLFKDRLLQPVRDVKTLQGRYAAVRALLGDGNGGNGDGNIECGHYKNVIDALSGVIDLERAYRRVALGTLPPCDWHGVLASLRGAAAALNWAKDGEQDEAALAHEVVAFVESRLHVTEALRYGWTDLHTSIFVPGAHAEIDALDARVKTGLAFLNERAAALGKGPEILRVDCNDRDGYFLTTTKRRWDALQFPSKASYTAKPISASSSQLRIGHPDIEAASIRIERAKKELSDANVAAYRAFLAELDAAFGDAWPGLMRAIAELDVHATVARNAFEFGYTEPVLGDGHSSYFRATQLRHPLLERLLKRVSYVPNDVSLDDGLNGLLLYGINASGKSSLMKAIGINVLLAQAGMFVAADRLELGPYAHLFTRITASDNLYRGMSTFTLEMSELRNVLQRCDARSLVLGDELCSGTEAVSALSIVAAGIEWLLKARAAFVFATHLHELTELASLKDHMAKERIGVFHMHIEVRDDGTLVYDRRLLPGQGSALYGLEVCRALAMPTDFLTDAHRLRREWMGLGQEWVASKASRYNARVFVDACGICGGVATETHHVRPQKDANAAGRVGALPLHHPANLVPLCDACHKKEHTECLSLRGYVQTSEGVVLVKERAADSADSKKATDSADSKKATDSAVENETVEKSPDPADSTNFHAHLAERVRATPAGYAVRNDPGKKWRTLARHDIAALERFLKRIRVPWPVARLEDYRPNLL